MQNPFTRHSLRDLPELLLAGLVLGAALLTLGARQAKRFFLS